MKFDAPWTRTATFLLGAALLAGCGDDGTDPTIEYEPEETLDRLDNVVDPLNDSGNALLALDVASLAIETEGAAGFADLLRLRPGAALPGSNRMALPFAPRAEEPGSDPTTLAFQFPTSLLGETLVWDVSADGYVVDESRNDAPSNGVRALYYAMDPFTREPVTPLQELGYIDLTDEDQLTSERIGILLVDTSGASDVVRLDYYVDLSGSGTGTQGTLRIEAEGFLTAGVDELEFELSHTFTWSQSQDRETLAMDYDYQHDDGSVRFRLETSMPFEGPDWEDLAISVDLENETDRVVIQAQIDVANDVEGDIEHNGRTVMLISGQDPDPVFTRPDGSEASGTDLAILAAIWNGVIELQQFSQLLFVPQFIVLAG